MIYRKKPVSERQENRLRGAFGGADGFSLLETMVTLCVVAVVTGIAVVHLGPAWRRYQLNLAAVDLKQQVQVLRMKAILHDSTFQARIEGQTWYFRRKTETDWEDWQAYALDDRVAYFMSGSSYFYSRGFASPKTVVLQNGEFSRRLIVNINGRARLSTTD
jgi:type II secretion system protein H